MNIAAETYNNSTLFVTVELTNTHVITFSNDYTITLLSRGVQGNAYGNLVTSRYKRNEANTTNVLSYNISLGGLFHTHLTSNVSNVMFTGFRGGVSQRLTIYFQQDSVGGRVIDSFSGVLWNGGDPPVLTSTPLGYTRVVVDSFDGGATIYGNWKAL